MSRSWGDRVSDEERETEEKQKRVLETAFRRGRREGMAEVQKPAAMREGGKEGENEAEKGIKASTRSQRSTERCK